MADKLIPNNDTQNYPFCRLQLEVEKFGYATKWTNQTIFKSPRLLNQRIRKGYYKTT